MTAENQHALDQVDAYLHGALDDADAARVERHCAACPICQVGLEEARKRFAAFETLPVCEASEELILMTANKIDGYETSKRSRRFLIPGLLAMAASLMLALYGFQNHYQNLAPTPFDIKLFAPRQLLAGTSGSLRIQLIDRATRSLLNNVPVEIALRDKSSRQDFQLASFTTNAQGSGQPRFQLPDLPDGTYELRITARPPGGPETLTQDVALARSWKLMLGSDKPVYQPGQTIHMRSLALRRPDLKPVAGQETVFTVTDPKGNVILNRRDVTSKYGIGSIDCPLANELIEGAYTLACKVGDTESKRTVEVKKYVLPKFKIDARPDQPYYQPGQSAKVDVEVRYFFGEPVAKGKLKAEVRSAGNWLPTKRLSADLDKDGKATLEFKIPDTLVGQPQLSGDAEISLYLTAVDSADQEQTKVVSRRVTASPLRIEVIPESTSLVPNVTNRIYVYASYADGRPAKTTLAVTSLDKELTTTELGVASFDVTPDGNEVSFTIKATDPKGLVARKHTTLKAGVVANDFVVRTDKSVYDGGETVHLTALGGGIEPLFVDFLKDGQTLLTETIDMNAGKGSLQFDLPAELFGTVELSAYRYSGEDALPVRKTRVLYVRQAKQLKIDAAMDHKEYRPGGKGKLNMKLTDSAGKPTPGALSLAAVDEAVFAVLDQAPGMEKTFYLLEQQLLQPVYAIYNWSPDLTTSVPVQERNQFEQALFSRTANQVGAAGAIATIPAPRAPFVGRPNPGSQAPPKNDDGLRLSSSFPAKEQIVKAAKAAGLQWVQVAWRGLGITALGLLACGLVYAIVLFVKFTPLVGWGSLVLTLFVIVPVASVNMLGRKAHMTFNRVGSAIGTAGGGADGQMFMFQERMPAPMAAAPPSPRALPAAVQLQSAPTSGAAAAESAPPRVREFFPETLLWRPEIITNDQGEASLEIELADSITTWQLSASAVSADGKLGALQTGIRVFQPFFVDLNLPVALTRNDVISIPAVVYNYLDKPQTVELTLADGNWFERLDDAAKKIELKPGEPQATSFKIRVKRVGNHQLEVMAKGSGVADALRKGIEVVPDGKRIEQTANGTLGQPAQMVLTIPEDFIDGSARAFVKIYPSSFSQLVEGLDNIFRMPNGCFEQTSSTLYPNVLALDYLRTTKKSVPEVEAKARQYIHLGYQRLLTFEIPGGGFDWFGRAPANRRLTAYGLLEFEDMAKVYDVDPKLVERTRNWLLKQRNPDGTWTESPGPHVEADPAYGLPGDLARYSMTAYVAWSVYIHHPKESGAQATLDYLLARKPADIPDPYLLALACNAMLAIDPDGKEVGPYLKQLVSMKKSDAEGKRNWWEQARGFRTGFYGAGPSGSIESTAMAVLALVKANVEPGVIKSALQWLSEQRDPQGTFHSTQATILALKALLAGTGKSLGGDKERRVLVTCGEDFKQEIVIPADQAMVMQQIDLTPSLHPGAQQVTLTDKSDTGPGYQVAFRYNVPAKNEPEKIPPLTIDMAFDRSDLQVGQVVKATATVTNRMKEVAPMVIVDVPIPPGFTVDADDFNKMTQAGTIAKFQVNPRTVIVYLRKLAPEAPLKLTYKLTATMPVQVTVPPAKVYEYYDPQKRGQSPAKQLKVG